MKVFRLLAIFAVLALIVCSVAACNKTEYKSTTLVAKVSEISADGVTFVIGELEGIELPEGSAPNMNGMQKPSVPDGEMPTMPDGEMLELPEGDIPAMPDGEMPSMSGVNGGFGGGMGNGNMGGADLSSSFKASKETITLTLDEEVLSTLTLNAIVMISFDAEGNATVTRADMMGGGRFPMDNGMIPPEFTDNATDEGISGEMGTMQPEE